MIQKIYVAMSRNYVSPYDGFTPRKAFTSEEKAWKWIHTAPKEFTNQIWATNSNSWDVIEIELNDE